MPFLLLVLLFSAVLPAVAQYSMFPPVRGTREMVAAANNFQVEAGYRMLQLGGNAVDAGVAAILTATVTEQSRIGLGGEMPLLLKMAGEQTPVVVISGVGRAPALATVEYYAQRKKELWEKPNTMPAIPAQGIRSAITPGLLDGLLLALRKHGTMSFAQVVAPAIEYADGHPIIEEYADFIDKSRDILDLWPDSKAYFMPGGEPPRRGSLFRQPALAKTLRELVTAEKKARGNRARKLQAVHDCFYKGSLAQRMAAFSEQNGGLIRYQDLASFAAEEDTSRTTNYRGYTVHKPGFWTQGPVMLQALNILEGYDLRSMGHNSPEYLHTLIEAVKLAFADRDMHYGDPQFDKQQPNRVQESVLLSKEYAAERRKLIDNQQASVEHRPGSFAPALPPNVSAAPDTANDTTCVNIVDRFGNVFSATPSGAWLPSVIAGDTGIPFSTRLQSFVTTAGHPNQLMPGKRPRVTLSPTLITKDGKPFLLLSTPGGDNQDQAMLQVILNIVEFGMTPQEAVEAPRFQSAHFYSSFASHEFLPGKLSLESRIPKPIGDRLSAMGHIVTVGGPWSNGSAPTAILLQDGVLHGGADPRRSRFVFGR